ncbi:hypothetical protein HYPSUDRAFT_907330 [Hypholoma sublateritium FD-334 SS-4]|uniref:DUF6533 domain-containing protein n=1 Tax=Hypholoma sublateritium (strain FD-334 SS-4) TaxID=945553 RepID=A0A0D2NQT4_HYPSF|nr:hypothetical protein HYPSUDRAFT_907330 [Hypholoma sublateritium FD-334 SS-4]
MAQGGLPVADISKILSSLSATKYANVASAALLVYDMILTFDQEVQYIWNAHKTLGTTIFFLNRYIPPCLFAFDLYCALKQGHIGFHINSD